MPRPVLPTLLAALLCLAGSALPAQGWEFKMISSGANRPAVPLWRAPWRDGLIALREGKAVVADSIRADLLREGAATAEGPSCLVVSAADGALIARQAAAAARRFLPRFLPDLEPIRAEATTRLGGRWEDAALLVLSNVLLDNWQIRGVEREWLAAERPARGGGRYYCALFEGDGGTEREPFGIWGNQVRSGVRWQVGVYGNDRRQPGLHNASAAGLALALGIDTASVPDSLRFDAAVDRLVGTPAADGEAVRRDLAERLGFWRDGRMTLVPLDADALAWFDALADRVRGDLVAFLRTEDPDLAALQASLGYASVPPAEFRIWWYHFFYSAVTDALVEAGWIPAGAARRVTYVTPRE